MVSNQPIAFPPPQDASTPAVNPSKRLTPVVSSAAQASVVTPIQTQEETITCREIR